jgi:hypothetical protein
MVKMNPSSFNFHQLNKKSNIFLKKFKPSHRAANRKSLEKKKELLKWLSSRKKILKVYSKVNESLSSLKRINSFFSVIKKANKLDVFTRILQE